VLGTANVLEAVRETGSVKAGVFITSDKCYENNGWVWPYREDDTLGGFDPYSASKACAELVISSFRNSYFLQSKTFIASTRAGNVIGGGDWSKDRIVPDIVRAVYEGKELSIRNPDAVRPWQHVLEPLSGYVVLAEKLWEEEEKFAQAWNFGPSNTEAVPVKDIVKQAIAVSGKHVDLKGSDEKHPHEAGYLMLDSSKAKSLLGWKAKFATADAVRFTMEWYDAFYKNEDMYGFTIRQIREYDGGA
jgi:CDP-glucose 4,6-dehydratase